MNDDLLSSLTVDDVTAITNHANAIKKTDLAGNMNHKISEGDVWAVLLALENHKRDKS